MRIAVYLGSALGSTPEFAQAVAQLGTWMARNAHGLVYGGTSMGCMKVLADAVKAGGGTVVGVVPQFMVDRGIAYEHLDERYVVETMGERKSKMIELADAFVACPGGPGTLEEVSEVISMIKLGKLQAPVVFLNVNGFYEPIKQQFQAMVENGFWTAEALSAVRFASTVDDLERTFV